MCSDDETVLNSLIPKTKLWLELNGEFIIGKGSALLLHAIKEHGSISQAVKALPVDALGEMESPSYRFAWGYLRKVEKRLGAPIVEKRRGYRKGTGGTALTQLGRQILDLYDRVEEKLLKILSTE